MNVYLESLGCRLNQSEVESLVAHFAEAGHTIVGDPAQADACIVNTCAVTAEAERKSRHRARALARTNPHARVAVIGCYATLAPQRCSALPGVAWVVPNVDKGRMVEIVASSSHPSCAPLSLSQHRKRGGGKIAPRRTRAFLKVQDGCDNHCTDCIVRLLRGPARSRPMTVP